MFFKLFVPVVALFITQSVLAQDCAVPVCDIAATIQDLKTKTQDQRQAFLSDLYQAQVATKDAASLRNLRAFGAEAYKLTKELNDPKHVIQWAANVRQLGQGLLFYADFNKEEFISTYSESATLPELSRDSQQRVRFFALTRWKIEVPLLLDIKTVYEVYDYVSAASQLSINLNDEDYIIREATIVLELLSARVSYLYPLYEGVFTVNAHCAPVAEQCEQKDLHSDRLVVMNSLTDLDVYASLTISKHTTLESAIGDKATADQGEINFLFVKSLLENNGTSLYSKSDVLSVGVRPSEVKVSFAANQNIRGSAVTSRNAGALNFIGNVVFSPLKFYVDQVPATKQQQPITGEFTGRFGEQPLRVIIRQRVDKSLMASAFITINKQGEVKKIDFSMGEFIPHRQLISLTGVGQADFKPYKIAMAYRETADHKLVWTGAFYSATGFLRDVILTYAGPVTDL